MAEFKASFDTTTKEGKRRVFNATNGASLSLKDLNENEVLAVTGVLIHEGVNNDGEINTITTLFAKDGNSYAGISATISKAAEGLIDYIQNVEEEVDIKIVKGKSKAGRDFLNIQMV